MEAKRMPAETAIPSEQKSHTMDTIPQRRPFGQAVPFAGYEKAAGSAKELVRLGRGRWEAAIVKGEHIEQMRRKKR